MKKLVTVSLLILVLTFAFATGTMADSGISIRTAVTHAAGGEGCYAMVYVEDSTGASYYVYTVDGVDYEPTALTQYKAPINYGANEIYVTAYDSSDEVIAVSDKIEIYGNDYDNIGIIKNYDFDTDSASFLMAGANGGGDKNSKDKVIGQKTDIGGTNNNVAWMKSENDYIGWEAWRPELHVGDYNWFSRSGGKNTYVYEIDIMPIQVGKTVPLGVFYYQNSAATEKSFQPITFTNNGTVKLATSLSTTYPGAPAMPEFDAPANEWISFKIIMDSVNEEIIIFANGVAYSSFGFDSTETDANIFDFAKTAQKCRFPIIVGQNGVPAGQSLEFYIDNIRYGAANSIKRYAVSASTVMGDDETDGLDEFPLSGGKIKLEFSEEMGEIKKEDFILEVNGDAISFDLVFDADTNIAIITPLYTFIGREICKISYENVKTALGAPAQKTPSIEFGAALPPCAIARCTASEIIPGENMEFSVTVRNSTSDDKDAMVLIGLYKDGGLESVIASEALCPAGEDTDCSAELYIPEDYDTFGYKIVAYFMYKDSFFIIDFFDYQV